MKRSFNVLKFLRKYYKDFKVVSGGREAVLSCPFHEGGKSKLYISLETGSFICFKCEQKGSFKTFIYRTKQLLGITSVELDTEEVSIAEDFPVEEKEFTYPEGFYFFDGKEGELGKQALQYLYKRGLSENEIYFYKLGYCISGLYENRIIIPVFEKGNLVSFVARDFLGFSKVKVLTPPGNGTVGIKRYLFNEDRARNFKHVILTEGVFDAMAVGFNAIALFGKAPTDEQFYKLLRIKPTLVTVCLDNDALKEASKLAARLTLYVPEVRLAELPEGEDPSSVDRNILKESLTNAKTVHGWGIPF